LLREILADSREMTNYVIEYGRYFSKNWMVLIISG